MWGLNEESATATASRPAGVESVDDVESAIAPAQRLARFMARHGANGTAAVAVSGATDMVTDGEHVYRLAGGSAMMTKITGAGCSLGGVTAVYLAVAQPLIAALAATSLYNTAGEIAEKRSNGPGSSRWRCWTRCGTLPPRRWQTARSTCDSRPSRCSR